MKRLLAAPAVFLAVTAMAGCDGSNSDGAEPTTPPESDAPGDSAAPSDADLFTSDGETDDGTGSGGDSEPDDTTGSSSDTDDAEPDDTTGSDTGDAGNGSSEQLVGSAGDAPLPSLPPEGAAVAEVGFALIEVDGAEYAFDADVCEFTSKSALIEGEGESADYGPFTASLYYLEADINGEIDRSFDVFIEFEVPEDGVMGDVPEFDTAVDNEDFGNGTFIRIDGGRIFGSAPMTDYSGLVFDIDEPGEMTFDGRCP